MEEMRTKELANQEKAAILETSVRKLKHIQICLEYDVQAKSRTTGLEDINFIHNATTDLNLSDIDLSATVFDKKLKIPLICSGMTGGHEFALDFNHILSQAVKMTGIGMGCGSQRAALEDKELEKTFSIIRKNAPDSLIIGNIGAGQIAEDLSIDDLVDIKNMVDANAVAIHFNPLQEAIQPEGDTSLKGLHKKIESIVSKSNIPIIAKEVGCGFSFSDFKKLNKMGFSGVDIQGLGGTSWSGVESIRANSISTLHSKTGEIFWDFGNPTALSTVIGVNNFSGTIIGSGGVRNGLDAAKLLALGAQSVGMAIPFLFSVKGRSLQEVVNFIKEFEYQLRLTCFLTGCEKVSDLKKVPLLITGKTADQFRNMGIEPSTYSNRK